MCRPAERVGFEPTVPLQTHLISNQAPSASRSSLRGGMWQGHSALSTGSDRDVYFLPLGGRAAEATERPTSTESNIRARSQVTAHATSAR